MVHNTRAVSTAAAQGTRKTVCGPPVHRLDNPRPVYSPGPAPDRIPLALLQAAVVLAGGVALFLSLRWR